MIGMYVLRDRTPVRIEDLAEWAAMWDSQENPRVALTEEAGWRVSTVFFGIDLRFGHGPPLVFEAMIFGGPLDGETERYSSWDEAEAGHARMVERARHAAAEAAPAAEED